MKIVSDACVIFFTLWIITVYMDYYSLYSYFISDYLSVNNLKIKRYNNDLDKFI